MESKINEIVSSKNELLTLITKVTDVSYLQLTQIINLEVLKNMKEKDVHHKIIEVHEQLIQATEKRIKELMQ